MTPKRLASVLWNGKIGGAESLNVTLAEHLGRLGVTVTVVFIGTPWPLAERLARQSIPYRSLDLRRGRDVLVRSHRYAREIARCGPDGALVEECGLMGTSLRAGGYRGPIVAVEHGSLLLHQRDPPSIWKLMRRLNRAAGARAVNAEVAVSDFMLAQMRQVSHAKRTMRIYNGVDPDTYRPPTDPLTKRGERLVVGFAGRLFPGKGVDQLIQAVAQVTGQVPVDLLIAGEGPERDRLKALSNELGTQPEIKFLGFVEDMPTFWQRCDIVAIPSDTFVESFSMVTLEAMACGKPIVAARNGAIPELMLDGITGTLVPNGNVNALAQALLMYAERPELQQSHGEAARQRAIDHFSIRDCARAYLELFDKLASSSIPKIPHDA